MRKITWGFKSGRPWFFGVDFSLGLDPDPFFFSRDEISFTGTIKERERERDSY